MTPFTVKSINFDDDQITVLFEESWYQEDISSLSAFLLSKFLEHKVKEITLGADRENTRFQWQEAEFMLNFDFYSQSCWFNAQDPSSTKRMLDLYKALIEK